MRAALSIFLLFTSLIGGAQNRVLIDSLQNRLAQKYLPDTVRIRCLNSLGWELRNTNIDTSRELILESRRLAKEAGFARGLATSYNSEAVLFWVEGELDKATGLYEKALEIYEEIGFGEGITSVLTNMGLIKMNQGHYETALDLFTRVARMEEERGDMHEYAKTLNNIGNIYYYQGLMEKSVEYMLKSKKVFDEVGDEAESAKMTSNLGVLSLELKDTTQALEYLLEAARLRESIGDSIGLSSTLSSMASLYHRQGKYGQAIEKFKRAIHIYEGLGEKNQLASTRNNLGETYFELGKFSEAQKQYEIALPMAEKIEDLDLLKTLHFNFARIYEKKGMFQFALEEYKLYEEIKDTIMNKEQQKVLTEMEIKFDSEEKERENEILRKEKELTIAEKKQAQLEQQKAEEEKEKRGYMLGAGFILLVGVGFISLVLYRSNRQKTRTNRIIKLQKEQVEVQRDLVSEKNKEILDSIEYAKRLQDAILPPKRLVKEYLPNSFVLYKPKDIVAGDFYFMEPVEDMVYYAAADCTGHGVPGAMVSVICSNAMNKAILEEGLRDPGEILNRVKELVIDRFERSEETVYDGMDVALVKLPKDLLPDDSDSLDIEFAGANNPLWIVRSGGNEVEEYRGDPVPIGRFAVDEEFSTHRVSLQKDDCAYVFSDGYADQFGGEKGKKFKSRNFKKLLSDIHSLPMQEQRSRLNNTFEKWRGEIEQIDDVCVIGLRV